MIWWYLSNTKKIVLASTTDQLQFICFIWYRDVLSINFDANNIWFSRLNISQQRYGILTTRWYLENEYMNI